MMMSDFKRLSLDKNSSHDQQQQFVDFAAKSLRGKGGLVLPVTQELQESHHQQQHRRSQSGSGTSLVSLDRNSSSQHFAADDATTDGSCSSEYSRLVAPNRLAIMTTLVIFVGAIGASIFIGYGIQRAIHEETVKFGLQTEEVALEIEVTLQDYERGGKWLHQACSTHHIDREEFKKIYQYISTSIDTLSIQWMPKVFHSEREQLENESKVFYNEFYPTIEYSGIIGIEPDPHAPPDYHSLQNRSVQDFYYPLHFVEPVESNEAILEFDAYSGETEREIIDLALTTWEPTLSKPFKIRQQTSDDLSDNSVLLFHPGIRLPHVPDQEPRDMSVLVVQVKSILQRGTQHLPSNMTVYLYGSSGDDDYYFVVAAELRRGDDHDDGEEQTTELVFLPELDFYELTEETTLSPRSLIEIYDIEITPTSRWTAVFVPLPGTYEANHKAVLAAGIFILVASMIIAYWLRSDMIRIRALQDTRRRAEAEKAAVTVKSARQAAKQEQELNDYIAHEVRNPLAAAMSACSFVKSAVEEKRPLVTEESISSVREDVEIIDTSLAFMNDLLRSMLDMHKAANKKVKLEVGPVDVLNDIILPVSSMLYQRNATFEIITECPENLFVWTDKMRLKQIMLNLARNSSKFVQEGFILLGASVDENNNVRLVVEDSGPGISAAKQKRLFSKFQESLDLTNQGTGMGLCLCKNMVKLLGGDIWLDAKYDSGVVGSPGSKFILDLKLPPMTDDEYNAIVNPEYKKMASDNSTASASAATLSIPEEKPLSSRTGHSSVRFACDETFDCLASASQKTTETAVTADDDQPNETGKTNNGTDNDKGESNDEDNDNTVDSNSLPEKFSVLFVDDDLVLRKLFARSVRKVVPTWDIKEAANGETALRMVETETFDLIFLDQYMASVEKQLLGTETARALRAKGVTSILCGLSANDVEKGFKQAGANDFLFKPFPCKPDELRGALLRVVHGKN